MSDQGFDAEGVDIGNPAGFIAQSIRNGLSMNQSLREFREAGGAARNEYWRSTYADVRDAMARSENVAGLNPDALPTGEDYAEWAMGRGGQYATQVTVFIRTKGTGDSGTRQFTYLTDEPHTPGEAEQAAIDEFTDPVNAGPYEDVVSGAMATNVYTTTPFSK